MVEAGGQVGEVDGEAAEEAEPVEGSAGGLQLVGEAAGVELFEAAGVQGEGAGEVADLPGRFSSTVTGMPMVARSPARRRPVGPEPTTMTPVWSVVSVLPM